MASVDWYFDFISPFAYLQCEELHQLGPGVRVRYRPVLFAGLLEAHSHKGPAEIVRKREFTYRYLVWHARRMQIPFKMPPEHPFNPLRLLRLAIACDCARTPRRWRPITLPQDPAGPIRNSRAYRRCRWGLSVPRPQ